MPRLLHDGGPAFPTDVWDGMTLRDYFAASAMQALLAAQPAAHTSLIAAFAYAQADAMLKARVDDAPV